MPETLPAKIGKYTVLSVLGRGGMGIVYKARDPIIDRIVAIKTISVSQEMNSEELRKRLQMEAQSAGRLQHPNVATLYDFGTFGDTSYIVMEYVKGTDLARVIDQKIELSLSQKLDVIIQIGRGLAYAHELDVVHRDMKPSNIRLTNRCVAKIIDFGLARFDSTRLTRTGFMSGTIAYMSPERIHGNEGKSDDIFALGAIAYELLTENRAFPGSTPPEVMMKIISQSPPSPSSVAALPPELDPVIMKGLARDAAERYASATALADAFDEFRHSDQLRKFLSGEPDAPGHAPWFRSSVATTLTLPLEADEAEIPTAMITKPADATALATATAMATATAIDSSLGATQVELPAAGVDRTLVEPRPPASRRFRPGWGAIAAIIVITALAALLYRRPGDGQAGPQATAPVTETAPALSTADTSAPTPVQAEVAGQRLLLTEVRKDLQSLRLDPDEQARLTRAETLAAMAEARYQERDYESTANLLNSAIQDLRQLRRDHYQRMAAQSLATPATVEVTAPASTTRAAKRIPQGTKERQDPVPAPPVTQTARPAPIDQAGPPDQAPTVPAQPAVDRAVKARAEITDFVAKLAAAYERRDVAFFREHDENFSERLAVAIRNSPSIDIAMEVTSIKLLGPDRAEVKVVRTDRFADPKIPVGVQQLTFTLARSDEQWRIVSMSRDQGR